MFYRKNLGSKEGMLRIALGLIIGVVAVMGWSVFLPTWAGIVVSVIVMLTGVLGFCPACALVGRKPLDKR